MAFTSVMIDREIMGTKWVSWGTYTSDSSTEGGDLDTGLPIIETLQLTPISSAVEVSAPVANVSDFPYAGPKIPIVTVADGVGTWFALGRF